MELLRVISIVGTMLLSRPVYIHLPDTTLAVIQQDEPAEVTEDMGVVTQFSLTDQDSIGLLAHNTREGTHFQGLEIGDILILENEVFLSGKKEAQYNSIRYEVVEIIEMQAWQPDDPLSPLKDLRTGKWYSVDQIYPYMYVLGDGLTLQTCIEREGIDNWGRLFIRSRRLQE